MFHSISRWYGNRWLDSGDNQKRVLRINNCDNSSSIEYNHWLRSGYCYEFGRNRWIRYIESTSFRFKLYFPFYGKRCKPVIEVFLIFSSFWKVFVENDKKLNTSGFKHYHSIKFFAFIQNKEWFKKSLINMRCIDFHICISIEIDRRFKKDYLLAKHWLKVSNWVHLNWCHSNCVYKNVKIFSQWLWEMLCYTTIKTFWLHLQPFYVQKLNTKENHLFSL